MRVLRTNNEKIIFDTLLSIGCLDIATMNFFRLNNVEKSHDIFEKIVAPFDFYYHDDILIIPDPIPKEKVNWNKMVSLYGQEIECIGRYIYFFHFDDMSDNVKGDIQNVSVLYAFFSFRLKEYIT